MEQAQRTWWHRENRPYDRLELGADAAVHILGMIVAAVMGAVLYQMALPGSFASPLHLTIYLGSLLFLLVVSMLFNQWPPTPFKMHLARLDQASIFLFLAGSYTPFLALLTPEPMGTAMMSLVWGASLIGIVLKLVAPHRFGRIAIFLYLAIGWSGVAVFSDLAKYVPSNTLLLLLAGGLSYTFGIIFHLWEQLRFQNALWHLAVVMGATLHLWAVLETMLNRLG
jgi:hemolysin III